VNISAIKTFITGHKNVDRSTSSMIYAVSNIDRLGQAMYIDED